MSSWKRPSFLLIAFIVLTALILAGCGAGKGSDKGTIIIGGALCLTGIQAPLDEPAVRGANLAVDEVNKKGGVLGRKIAFLNLDGKSDPVTVGNVAVELIKKGAKAMETTTYSLLTGKLTWSDAASGHEPGIEAPLVQLEKAVPKFIGWVMPQGIPAP